MSHRNEMGPRDLALLALSAGCTAGIILLQRLKPKPRSRFHRIRFVK